jgi:hypothetical protein
LSLSLDELIDQLQEQRRKGITVARLIVRGVAHPVDMVWTEPRQPCGHTEPESDYRDPDTGKHRTARCEGGRLVVRGNGRDSVTDGTTFLSARPCPHCAEGVVCIGDDPR